MISEHGFLKDFQRRIEERRAWEAANNKPICACHPQGLVDAWNEARQDDQEITARREAEVQRLEALARFPSLLEDLGVPRRCADVLGAAKDTPSLEAARGFVPSEHTFLLLLGSAGAGKSVAAAWALAEAVRPIFTERPYNAAEWFMRRGLFVRASAAARTGASDFDREDRERFEDWCSTRFLVLDDLGTERAWDGWLSRLDELIDRRYGDKLRTVITSNLDGKTFKERYGERISDRIRHDGQIVIAGAESMRRAQ